MKKILAIVIFSIFGTFFLSFVGYFAYNYFLAFRQKPIEVLIITVCAIGGLLVACGMGFLLYWCENQLEK